MDKVIKESAGIFPSFTVQKQINEVLGSSVIIGDWKGEPEEESINSLISQNG